MTEMDYARRSFENMVGFYAEGLRRIMAGERSSDVFNERVRSCLFRWGILSRRPRRGRYYSRNHVTAEAKEILEDLT